VNGPVGVDAPLKPRLRGVSHQVAAIAFPFFGLALVVIADGAAAKWSVFVYTAGLTSMYAASATYHRGHWTEPVRLRLRRLDHAMIVVAIASTYTPIAVIGLSHHSATVLLSVVWSLAVVGVVLQLLWLHAPRWLVALLYIGLGWTAIAFAPTLWRDLGALTFSLLLAGGIVYSLGAVVYSTRRPDPVPEVFGYHEIFHALVITAGFLFYVAIARVVVA
jgi:hemolysin III